MCELLALSSRLPTSVTLSLSAFAQHRGADDGWGVAFYDSGDARLYKEPELAAESEWLAVIQQRRLSASLFISHIRYATRGNRSLPNTQPFSRELGGRVHLFATTAGSTASNAIMRAAGNAIGRSARQIRRSPSASCSSGWRHSGKAAQFPHCTRDLPSSRSLPPTWPPSVRPISFIRMAMCSSFMGTAARRRTDVLRRPGFGVFHANARSAEIPPNGIRKNPPP